jgi:hypothetical protein
MIRLAVLFFLGIVLIAAGMNASLGSILGALIAPAAMIDDTSTKGSIVLTK